MRYIDMQRKHQKEFDNMPIFFAFNQKQFDNGLKKFGATADEIVKIPHGIFMRKTEVGQLKEMFTRHGDERKRLFEDDKFLTDAIEYELANHEYCITYDYDDAFDALGIEMDDGGRIEKCFEIAKERYLAQVIC